MNKILLTTVHRSFTHSVHAMLQEELGDVYRMHTWPNGIVMARTGNYRVITTYRDPRDVAATWAKRSQHWRSGLWRAQWEAWAEIVPTAERIYRLEDLDRKLGSMGQYEHHRKTKPLEADIRYAEDICKEVLNG